MKTSKNLISIFLFFIVSVFIWNLIQEKIYIGDNNFVMRSNNAAPDGKHRIIEFDIDTGALGYSGWTAITPFNYQKLNLAEYKIPKCADALGWADSSELIVSIENCNASDQNQLRTSNALQGIKMQIVSADDFLLENGVKRKRADPNINFH